MRPDFGSKHCNISIMESKTKVPDPYNLGA